jgi:alpha-L-fucosidase 2
MLVQSDEDEIRLLPALPSAWPSGRVTGLRTRGGFEIDLSWKDGAVDRVGVRSLRGRALRLRRGETLRVVQSTERGSVLTFSGDALRSRAAEAGKPQLRPGERGRN